MRLTPSCGYGGRTARVRQKDKSPKAIHGFSCGAPRRIDCIEVLPRHKTVNREKLASEIDETKRQMLLRLLAAEEAKLATLDDPAEREKA